MTFKNKIADRVRKVSLAWVLAFLSVALLPGLATAQTTDNIAGTVSLPSGLVAPAGGIGLDIFAFDSVNGGFEAMAVNIPAGASSAPYSIAVPTDLTAQWTIEYFCISGCTGYITNAYYSTSGTTAEFSDATPLAGGSDYSGIDVEFIESNTITGTISLPGTDVAPVGGFGVDVFATNNVFAGLFSTSTVIPAGSNSATYTIDVPQYPTAQWRIEYNCFSSDCPGYVSNGYYTFGGTDPNFSNASLLTGGADHSGIDLELIIANSIQGTVLLPSGDVAPAGGLNVSILARDTISDLFHSTNVFFPAGANTAIYAIDVAQDSFAQWEISTCCLSPIGIYYDVSLYSDTGTVHKFSEATLLAGGIDHNLIDLDLVAGNIISGTVSLPGTQVAPAEGIFRSIFAQNQGEGDDSIFVSSFVGILEGESSTTYSIRVPPDISENWTIAYSCPTNSCDEFTNDGFYSSVGTVPVLSEASLLAGGVDALNINLTLLEATTISGTVNLPAGIVIPPEGIVLDVNILDLNRPVNGFYETMGSFQIVVNPGDTSFTYDINVFDDGGASLVVDFTCFEIDFITVGSCDAFANDSYYGSTGAVFDFNSASVLPGGVDHTGIDIDAISADFIYGTISLPSGVAPAGGVEIGMSAAEAEDPFGFAHFFSVIIPEGDFSMSYLLKVPSNQPANSWIVQAECIVNCDLYETFSYYSVSGPTPIQEQATTLPNTQTYSDIDFSLFESYSGQPPECTVLVDDFSGQSLSLGNWHTPETSRQVVSEKAVLSQKLTSGSLRGTFGGNNRFELTLTSLPSSFSADMAITEADLTDSDTGTASASLRGFYYYTLGAADTPDESLGVVYAAAYIGDRGMGLEAWYEILESTDANFNNFITHHDVTLIPPGTLTLGVEYPVQVDYNSATKEFIFSVNSVSGSSFGPSEGVTPGPNVFRRLSAAVNPEYNQDLDPISAVATFDNVIAGGILYDDFSLGMLNEASWEEAQSSREIAGGKMRSEVIAESSTRRSVSSYPLSHRFADGTCLQATVSIASTSDIPANTRGRNRIEGYWYNALNNYASGYNGNEGNVYAHIAFEQTADGTVRAAAYAEQVDDAGYSSATQLLFHSFNTPASLDVEYVVAIELDKAGKQLLFRFEDEVFVYPIQTDINPVEPPFDYLGITARVDIGPGEIHALVDNVYITPARGDIQDHNDDTRSDVFFRNLTNGENRVWLMNGGVSVRSNPGNLVPNIDIVKFGDFNGDNKTDYFFRNSSTGSNEIWLMDGNVIMSRTSPGAWPTSYDLVVLEDFNGDGKTDIWFRNTTSGANRVWLMDGGIAMSKGSPGGMASSFDVMILGDFNADRKADVIFRDSLSGLNRVWLMDGVQPSEKTNPGGFLNTFDIVEKGDFNGDGRTDLWFRDRITGVNRVWIMRGGFAVSKDNPGRMPIEYVPHSGDFNADGKTDIWFRDGNAGVNRIWLMNGGFTSIKLNPGRWPETFDLYKGDYNGDGTTDVLFRDPTSGGNRVWLINDGAATVKGNPGGWPGSFSLRQGDFDGNGTTDLWFRDDSGSGANRVWVMDGAQPLSKENPGAWSSSYQLINSD